MPSTDTIVTNLYDGHHIAQTGNDLRSILLLEILTPAGHSSIAPNCPITTNSSGKRNHVAQTRWNILRAKSIVTDCQHRAVSSEHHTKPGGPGKRHGIGYEFIPTFDQAVGMM